MRLREIKLGGYCGSAGAPDVLPFVESDLRAIAAGVVAKARELCATNSVIYPIFSLFVLMLI